MSVQPFVLAGSAARTATGNGDTTNQDANVPPGRMPQMLLQLDVTAVAGTTPSVTVLVEDSLDGGSTWNTIATFVAATTVSRQVIQCALSGVAQAAGFRWPFNPSRLRCRWTISGTTPSLTFSVKGQMV